MNWKSENESDLNLICLQPEHSLNCLQVCVQMVVTVWPCDKLPTGPGNSPLQNLANLSAGTSGFRKWMEVKITMARSRRRKEVG